MTTLGLIHLPLFVLSTLLLNVTPGPDTAYVVGRSLAQGRAAGLVSSFGISAGCCVHVLAASLGLSALLATSTYAFAAIKCVGAVYLAYLGTRMIWATRGRKPLAAAMPAAMPGQRARSYRKLFFQGFLTNVLNPKVAVFFLSFFPQFVQPDTAHRTLAFLMLGGIFIVMSTVWNGIVAWVSAGVSRGISGNAAVKTWVDRAVGALFIGVAARIAATLRS
ncbi:LysE family translocator [Achromobacter aloeverae]|uniref:Lysine transporter LysE n=1 Tax=Achromobacter aloeverae TaxID=1750518 RepID=A0A4Q1HMV0_9BURK|nr:LysE family translocator [Achromobacter aloeverae]RXN91626.1 lysine transporter LysE [Achromobacter aloeverae]